MKKEKMKYYVRKNLISFLIGLILFGSIGVYAIVTFNSKDVSYENEASGLASKNVQGAIDELYTECTAEKIDVGGEEVVITTTGDGLYKDEYEEGRYIYKGKNVNNYITFNNEVWRIVSVEPDKTIKIMREASIGNRAWDSSDSNNWARPASLNTYLNGSYLTETLNSTAQGQIVPKDWSIGTVTYNNNDLADQIKDEKATTWSGKVALVTVSEYLRSNSNQNSCGTFSKNNSNYDSCISTTWMQHSSISYWWTLSPNAGYSNYVFHVISYGRVGNYYAHDTTDAVRPAVYLSSGVQIVSGDGSQNNPYQILSTGQF